MPFALRVLQLESEVGTQGAEGQGNGRRHEDTDCTI